MLIDKADTLPFLILSAHLIFAEKIVIIVMCLISAVLISIRFSSHAEIQCAVYRIKFSGNGIRILDAWRNIILAIKKSKHNALNNKFLEYEEEWNVVKMKYSGKCKSEVSPCFISPLLISEFFIQVRNYFISGKFSCRK